MIDKYIFQIIFHIQNSVRIAKEAYIGGVYLETPVAKASFLDSCAHFVLIPKKLFTFLSFYVRCYSDKLR